MLLEIVNPSANPPAQEPRGPQRLDLRAGPKRKGRRRLQVIAHDNDIHSHVLPKYVPALPLFPSESWRCGLPAGRVSWSASFSPLALSRPAAPDYFEDNAKGQTKSNKVLRNSAKHDILSLERTPTARHNPQHGRALHIILALLSPTRLRVFPTSPRPSTTTFFSLSKTWLDHNARPSLTNHYQSLVDLNLPIFVLSLYKPCTRPLSQHQQRR